jgi:hypothetical protein
MIGLIAIFLILGYILLFALALKYAKNAAIKRGRPPWHFTLPAGIAMYMIVFWDLIPTYAARTYYCTVHAGLNMYKTPDEWIKDNPGMVEQITPIEPRRTLRTSNGFRSRLNERFEFISEIRPVFFGFVVEDKESIMDLKNNNILAERVDYKTGSNSFGTGANSLNDYKSWLYTNSCVFRLNPSKKWFFEEKAFSEYLEEYKSL